MKRQDIRHAFNSNAVSVQCALRALRGKGYEVQHKEYEYLSHIRKLCRRIRCLLVARYVSDFAGYFRLLAFLCKIKRRDWHLTTMGLTVRQGYTKPVGRWLAYATQQGYRG